MGLLFASQGISQVGNFLEAIGDARVAVYQALIAINRTPGSAEKIMYTSETNTKKGLLESSMWMERSEQLPGDLEKGFTWQIRAILPKFTIDSLCASGLRPDIKGAISFQDVHFAYPSRPNDPVLKKFSLEVEAGTTVALVGVSIQVCCCDNGLAA